MLGKFFAYVKRRKAIVNDFKVNTKYLCDGTYVFNDTINYITRNDVYTKRRTYQLFQNNYYVNGFNKFFALLLKKTFFRKEFTISERGNQLGGFSGTVYLPVRSTNSYSDKKIFDFTNNQVLTIFSKEKDYRLFLNHYETFKNYFSMPEILWNDDKQLLIIEELIINQPNNSWEKEDFLYVMINLYDHYIHYFKAAKTKGINHLIKPNELLSSLPKGYDTCFIRNKINSELLEFKYPSIKLHGDLWTANILLVKNEESDIYLIDWEWSNQLIFFYDLFLMMWHEVIKHSNYIYIEKYAKGEYDSYFKEMFGIFEIEFQAQFRLDYLNIFFINLFTEKTKYSNEKSRIQEFQQYKKFIQQIKTWSFLAPSL